MTQSKRDLRQQEQIDYIQQQESPLRKYGPQIVGVIFLAGGGWFSFQSLQDAVAENQAKIQEKTEQQAETDKNVALIKQAQDTVKEDIKEVKEEVKDLNVKLDKILEEVRKGNGKSNSN